MYLFLLYWCNEFFLLLFQNRSLARTILIALLSVCSFYRYEVYNWSFFTCSFFFCEYVFCKFNYLFMSMKYVDLTSSVKPWVPKCFFILLGIVPITSLHIILPILKEYNHKKSRISTLDLAVVKLSKLKELPNKRCALYSQARHKGAAFR